MFHLKAKRSAAGIQALLLAGLLGLGSSAQGNSGDHHHDHGKGKVNESSLSLNNGKKWPTDASLRTGMDNIRKMLDSDLSNHHVKKLSSEQYESLSNRILKETDMIFKNCKLPAKADAMLHIVLAQVLGGAGEMKSGKTLVERQMGVHKVATALGEYGAYFDHPGWKPVSH